NVHDRSLTGPLFQPGDDIHPICHWRCIRHGHNRRKAPGGGGLRTCTNGFFGGLSGLTEMHMNIDQPRCQNQPFGIHFHRCDTCRKLLNNFPLLHPDVFFSIQMICRINDTCVSNPKSLAHKSPPVPLSGVKLPPLSKYKTAMRTANPLVTCSRTTELAPSATSLAISTPRFIGPGRMIRTFSLHFLNRAEVSPNSETYSPREGNIVFRCRSCWIRRRLTTSASDSTASRSRQTSTPF